jgi:zinc protease
MTSTPVRSAFTALLSLALLSAPPQVAFAQDKAKPARSSAAQATSAAVAVAVDHSAWLYQGSDIPPDAGWSFGRLPNGLRFAVRRNGVPPGQVSIRLRVDAGALMERPEEAGWAHLIEHLTFRESRYLQSGEARRAWQRLGVSFGSDTNANTGTTATTFQLDIPAATPQALQESMRLLSGMIREPVLSNATIDAERPIVMAERREFDGPQFRIDTANREHVFAGQLMGERSVIGTEQTLRAANAAGIQAFHDRWYRPDRVVIAIAGDLDPALFESAIVANFADWRPRGPAPTDPDFGRPSPNHPVARVVVEPSQPMVAGITYLRPWTRVTDSVAYTRGLMLNTLSTLIINRRLEERARAGGKYLLARVEEDKPSRSAWVTSVTVVPLENDWRGAIADVRSVIAAALATPPTQAEINREFADVETLLQRELANAPNEPGTKQAEDLLHAVDIGETTTSPDHALQIWQSTRSMATPADMLQRTRTLFSGDAQRILLTSPVPVPDGESQLAALLTANPTALADNQAARRPVTINDLPRLGRPGTVVSRAPVERFDMERWELANGVTALVRNTPIEPNKVRINVRWGGGRAGVPANTANLLWAGEGALVESGIGRLDQSALDRLANGRQLGMDFDIDDDAFEFTAETSPQDLPDQLRLLASKFAAPGWQAAPVQRLRAGLLLSHDTMRSSPMAVMENELQGLLYSRDPRYMPPSREQIDALTPAAFRAFWEPQLRQGPIEVQIFGDLGSIDLDQLVRSTFGALPARQPVPGGVHGVTVTPPSTQPIIVHHNGGDTQAAVILAYPTAGGLDSMQTARQLDILAAVFNDRLYERLRDQAGASYSQAVISHWPTAYANGGYLFVAGMVRPQDKDVMTRAAQEIAAQLVAAPVSADELRRATGPASEQIVRASSGNVFWMYQTEGGTRDPRVFTALRTYLSDLTRVTPQQLQVLAARYLQPNRAVPLLIMPEDAGSAGGSAHDPGTAASSR